MKLIVLYASAFAIMLMPSAAGAEPRDPVTTSLKSVKSEKSALRLPNVAGLTKALWKADRSVLPKQRWKSATVLAFFDGKGKWLRATRHEKCWEVPWQRSCTVARASYRLHSALAAVATRRLMAELPVTNDWRTAVRIAQRAYPGTEAWLLSCSASEGSWGKWVPNREGSGVGGWMQMYPSTYRTMMHGYYSSVTGRSYPGAWADLKSRGFIVPASADSWYSPLGQALASAYGKLNGRGGEWHGGGC